MVTSLARYVDTGRPFAAYVVGIATHKVAEHRRRHGRRREEPVESLPESVDESADPAQAALAGEAPELLADLPEQYRRVLLLRVAGFSGAEVGAALDMSANAVRGMQAGTKKA